MSLLRAEYRKISRRKIFPGMTLVLLVFVGLAAFFLIAFRQISPEMAGEIPELLKPEVYEVGAQQAATQFWFPLILAVVLLGGELSTTVWATALTRDSRKVRHIISRFFTYSAATTVASLVAFALWVVFAHVRCQRRGLHDGQRPRRRSLEVRRYRGRLDLDRHRRRSRCSGRSGRRSASVWPSTSPRASSPCGIPWENVSLTAASTALFDVDFGSGGLGGFVPGGGLPLWHQFAILAGLDYAWARSHLVGASASRRLSAVDPPQLLVPAPMVPMSAHVDGIIGDHHEMERPRWDRLVTSRAHVLLDRLVGLDRRDRHLGRRLHEAGMSRFRKPTSPATTRATPTARRARNGVALTSSAGMSGTWLNGDRFRDHWGNWRIWPS